MSIISITARVPEIVAQKLNYLAAQNAITRQEFVEKVLTEATVGTEIPPSFRAKTYVPTEVLEAVKTNSEKLLPTEETSLKRLVGEKMWSELENSTRRNFGKDFKEMVLDGEFPCLSVGKKRSNNEQMYVRL